MKILAALVVALALAAGAFFGIREITDDGDDAGTALSGPQGSEFELEYPDGWAPLSAEELEALPERPVAVLRHDDGKGLVVVRREQGSAAENFDRLAIQVRRELEQRIPDYREQSSKTITLAGKRAFFTSYVRERTGTVHTLVLVPDGKRSYTLNTVSRGGSDKIAREVGDILLSFSP